MRIKMIAALAESSKIMMEAGAPLIGAIVSYDVNSGDVERALMRLAFVDAGFPDLAKAGIPDVSVSQGLKMAPSQLKPPKNMSVSPITDKDETSTAELGVYYGKNLDHGGKNKPQLGGRVVIDQSGKAVAMPPTEGEPHDGCMSYAAALASRANRLSRFVETNDVTGTLASIFDRMFGAKFSSYTRGGFILGKFVEPWVALMEALEPYGVVGKLADLYGLPTHKAEAREVTEASFAEKVTALRGRLAEAAKGKGTRSDSLQRSLDECINVVNQANLFSDILGDVVKDIQAEVAKVKKHFVNLQGGTTVVYGAVDVEKPLNFGPQAPEAPPSEPGVKHLADGTTQIPSTPASEAGESAEA
jgi:hypothetical protein